MNELIKHWHSLDKKDQAKLFVSLNEEEQAYVAKTWEFMARTKQLPPSSWGKEHKIWAVISGRGFGKTRIGAEEVLNHVEKLGSQARVALIGSTSSDVRDVMIEGESGLIACAQRRGMKAEYQPSKRRVVFPNGAICTGYTAEKPDRLRGPQHTMAWCDELSSWEYDLETWDMMRFGLRLGEAPTVLITTTPKPRQLMKKLLTDKGTYVTRGSTFDNRANLSPSFIEAIKEKYEGTRLGQQELYGEMLEDNPDALWQPPMLDDHRKQCATTNPDDISKIIGLDRIVIGIDPAVTSGDKSDETGIIVVGVNSNEGKPLAYVLEDQSGKYTPEEWAKVVRHLYTKWQADRVIAEVNNGGDLVETVLRTHDPNISYKAVRASKGKRARAEPVAALYEQGKVSHVGYHEKLEEQMIMYTPDNFDGSPDRVDALVWALTELMLNKHVRISFL